MSATAYFDTIRRARAAIKIPDQYLALNEPLQVAPAEIERAFIKANPGLTPDGIVVDCRTRRLDEVRICLSRDLGFRACSAAQRRSCHRDKLDMPPMRGG